MTLPLAPMPLSPNQPHRFYRGGRAIAAFRGLPHAGDRLPEDWIGSTTPTGLDSTGLGLTRIDGRLLGEMIGEDPAGFLGPDHVARFGADPALLVKLLAPDERLLVHAHPSRAFATEHLGQPYGKTEVWFAMPQSDPDAVLHVGFTSEVEAAQLLEWVSKQQISEMLAHMNELRLAPGQHLYVPEGVPHSIGAGAFICELQEPTDSSVILEWEGHDLDGRRDGHMGLGFERALECVDRSAWDGDRLDELQTDRPGAEVQSGVRTLFPARADAFFRAQLVDTASAATLAPAFSLLVVLDGEGAIETASGTVPVVAGDTYLVPFAAGAVDVSGDARILRCMPPDPLDPGAST